MRVIAIVALALGVAVAGCMSGPAPFRCCVSTDFSPCPVEAPCDPGSYCVDNACAAPAAECPSRLRYDESAGFLIGQCVAAPDMDGSAPEAPAPMISATSIEAKYEGMTMLPP